MKIQFKAGQAKPGPALAGAGIQMPKFCTAFNDQTKDRMGETVPVVLTDKLKEIAEYKMPDLNAYDLDAAMKIVAGTAKNMGVKVEGIDA